MPVIQHLLVQQLEKWLDLLLIYKLLQHYILLCLQPLPLMGILLEFW